MRDPAIVSSAPGRAGILGNPSDMYGGTVISIAVSRRAYVAIEPAADLRLVSLDAGLDQVVRSPRDLDLTPPPTGAELGALDEAELAAARRRTYLNVLKAVLAYQRWADRKATITCWSEIPPNAGLTSSSALVAAALHATDRFLGVARSSYEFAETARHIEFNFMGVTCGFQDFYATTFGGLLYMDFRDKQDWRGPDVEPFGTVENLGDVAPELPLVVASTGLQRDSGATHRPLRERWLDGERKVVDGVAALGALARQGKKHLLARNLEALGRLMNENQRIIRELGGSGVANDRLIDKARDLGAWATKLAGAGQGGTIICLHPDPKALAAGLLAAGAADAFVLGPPATGVRPENALLLHEPLESKSQIRPIDPRDPASHPGWLRP